MLLGAHIDFETASPVNLKKAGLHKYVEHPATRIWGFVWRIDGGPYIQWRWGDAEPTALLNHIRNGGIIVAHNAAFERYVWNRVLRRQYPHWPELRIEQQRCTMARAAAIGLPQDLDTLGEVLALTNQKDRMGHALMMKMAKPRGVDPHGNYIWWDAPENVDRLMTYCEQDVRTECDADTKLPPLTDYEQYVWHFDQVINERGVRLDLPVIKRANELVDVAKKQADRRMRAITGGHVRKVTEAGKLAEWITANGVPCTSVKKGEIEDIVFQAEVIDQPAIKEAIELRKSANKTSTAKYKAMLECICNDERARGLLAYHAAKTGRWGGRLIQPQNLPRFDQDNPEEKHPVEYLVQLLQSDMTIPEIHDCMMLVHGDVMNHLSKALRSMIIAAPGHKLVGGDYSNIEGRVNAWLAGEQWKLEAFAAYDAGTGPDLYKVAYAKSFGTAIETVTKAQRQIGKVQELALGYQGGVGAFIDMGEIYNVNPYEIAKVIIDITPPEKWDAVAQGYEKATDKSGLQEREWTAIKIIVQGWRAAHPGIVQSWWDYQDAAISAVAEPHSVIACANGRIRYMSDGNFLYCCLPSGRVIAYAQPTLHEEPVVRINRYGEEYETIKRSVRYWGIDSTTKQWSRQYMYGGLQCENIVQGASRCLMVEGMTRVEQAGYYVILTVHDEILSEVKSTFGNATDFKNLMSILPAWADGLPLAAAAWEDQRYVK